MVTDESTTQKPLRVDIKFEQILDRIDLGSRTPVIRQITIDPRDMDLFQDSYELRITGVDLPPTLRIIGETSFALLDHLQGSHISIQPTCCLEFTSGEPYTPLRLILRVEISADSQSHFAAQVSIELIDPQHIRNDLSPTRFIRSLVPHHPDLPPLVQELNQIAAKGNLTHSDIINSVPKVVPRSLCFHGILDAGGISQTSEGSTLDNLNLLRFRTSILLRAGFDLLIRGSKDRGQLPTVVLDSGSGFEPLLSPYDPSAKTLADFSSIRDQISAGCTPVPIVVERADKPFLYSFIDLESDGSTQPAMAIPAQVGTWMNELLNLDFRSRLLNFEPSTKGLLVRSAMEIGEIEDRLAKGETIALSPAKNDLQLDSSLLTDLTEQALLGRVKTLITESRTYRRNNGSNNLYLTLGLLRWSTPDKPDISYDSPIFLIPINLSHDKTSGSVSIRQDPSATISPNVALVEALRRRASFESSWADAIPQDSWGIDVELSLNALEDLLRSSRGVLQTARVLRSVSVSLLDFANSRLWLDLDTHWSQFEDSPAVKTLIGESKDLPLETSVESDPHTVLPVFELDRFQVSAIQRALKGESFVLEGPPGSGKSQTIACLIANAMFHGKTVLFAAEKDVALSAVRSRLESVGLLDACLDLSPDHGSSYGDFKRQVEHSLMRTSVGSTEGVPRLVNELAEVDTQLATYADALHDITPSLYELAADFIRLAPPHLLELGPKWSQLTEDQKSQLFTDLQILIQSLAGIGQVARRSWPRLVDASIVDDSWIDRLRGASGELVSLATALSVFAELKERENYSTAEVVSLFFLSRWPLDHWSPDEDFRTRFSPESVAELCQRIVVYQNTNAGLTGDLVDSISLQDLNDIIARLRDIKARGEIGMTTRFRTTVRGTFAERILADLDPDSYLSLLTRLQRYIVDESLIQDEARRMLGEIPHPSWTPRQLDAAETLFIFAQGLQKLYERSTWFTLLGTVASVFDGIDIAEAKRLSSTIGSLYSIFGLSDQEFDDWVGTDRFDHLLLQAAAFWRSECQFGQPPSLAQFSEIATKFRALEGDNLVRLEASFDVSRTDLELFSRVVEGTRLSYLLHTHLQAAPLSDFGDIRLDTAVDLAAKVNDMLQGSSAPYVLDAIISRFDSVDVENRTKAHLTAKLASLKSTRDFLTSHFEAVVGLLPCFIGTPDSIARRIDPLNCHFDIVVLDEASQITPENALGVIGRGSSCVIVGDSKQMPPTRVGKLRRVDQSEGDDLVAPDSVLSLAVMRGLPTVRLRWHYRSERESLIAFSNMRYYGRSLLSYPENWPVSDDRGVSLRRVNGQFDHSGSRTNRIEAEAMVSELLHRVNDLGQSSIAIIVMNVEQQGLIQQMLLNISDTKMSLLLDSDDDTNSITVLNLESSQGIERDVVLFGVCYSKEIGTDSVPLRFGGLVGLSGQRRLNVAVSRARKEMIVFASFDPEAITSRKDLASAGVADLGDFMQFARDGFAEEVRFRDSLHPDLPVLEAVCKHLRTRGLVAETRIGMSDFRVDIAVRRPEVSSWELGVLIDGLAWYERTNTLERIVAPRQFLSRAKGWPEIRMLWAVEWMSDPRLAAEQIVRWVHHL